EDGIRGFHVTGVQTCALPISTERDLVAQPTGLVPRRRCRHRRPGGGFLPLRTARARWTARSTLVAAGPGRDRRVRRIGSAGGGGHRRRGRPEWTGPDASDNRGGGGWNRGRSPPRAPFSWSGRSGGRPLDP